MSPTQTFAGQAALPADALQRGQMIYDEIMAQIEPELITENLPTLGEKYQGETQEEAAERAQRYDAAFAEYDQRYAQYMTDMTSKVKSFQRTVRAGIESDEQQKDASGALQNLESSLSTL